MEIAGKAFVVTGGASGLGAATVRKLVGRGGRVVIADMNEPAGDAFAGELGEGAVFVRTDVTQEADGTRALEKRPCTLPCPHASLRGPRSRYHPLRSGGCAKGFR